MLKSPNVTKPVRANVTADRENIATRTSCAQVVSTNGPNSLVWKSTPAVQSAGEKLIAAGIELGAADSTVLSLYKQLETALGIRGTKVGDFDAAYGVYVANVESYAQSPEDVTGLGLALATKNKHALAAPLGIAVKFDAVKGTLRIHVKKAPGMQASIVEICTDANDPVNWRRLPGIGAIHKLSGLPSGTCWVRAASVRANDVSEFTGPVPVTVK